MLRLRGVDRVDVRPTGLISGPPHGLVVTARGQLRTPTACAFFMNDLLEMIDSLLQRVPKVVFMDFDISHNEIPYSVFGDLFFRLADLGLRLRIKRLRIFSCPTANDFVASLMSVWLRSVTIETAPDELHLSHCAFTWRGFAFLMDAFNANTAFPTPRNGAARPLYMRLENNFIDPAAIQAALDTGAAMTFQKGRFMHAIGLDSGAKVKILVKRLNMFEQKTGTPPWPSLEVMIWQPEVQEVRDSRREPIVVHRNQVLRLRGMLHSGIPAPPSMPERSRSRSPRRTAGADGDLSGHWVEAWDDGCELPFYFNSETSESVYITG